MEYSRRRAQSHLDTSLYAYLAGCALSSNAQIRVAANIPVSGTMGHEFIQSYGDEKSAFDAWLTHNPDRPVLLIDTIDTISSGLPNAIECFKKHYERIRNAGGKMAIRNDSGDLDYLAIHERIKLDEAGLGEVKIIQTNCLDEYTIQDIKNNIFNECTLSGIDSEKVLASLIWAAGEKPGTCSDQPSLGGVAKLTSIHDALNREQQVIKVVLNQPAKTSIPGSNRSTWIWDAKKELSVCLIHHRDENPMQIKSVHHKDDEALRMVVGPDMEIDAAPRQQLVFDSYSSSDQVSESMRNDFVNLTQNAPVRPIYIKKTLIQETLQDIRDRVTSQVGRLHRTQRRLLRPHTIKVGLSPMLYNLRKDMKMRKMLQTE